MTLPIPRLRHCQVGSRIKLAHDSKDRTILRISDHYAHFDGDDKASLCCQVADEYMKFTSNGWEHINAI